MFCGPYGIFIGLLFLVVCLIYSITNCIYWSSCVVLFYALFYAVGDYVGFKTSITNSITSIEARLPPRPIPPDPPS